MFIGHFAVGLAAKNVAPRLSLGVIFLACQLLDLVWPVLVLLGVERVRVEAGATKFTPLDFEHYPWSHSLGMSLLLSLGIFALLKAFKRTHLEATVVAVVVLSHWVLDFVTHRPDLPLWFGDGSKWGLGLWDSVAGTLALELALFGAGVTLYVRQTRADNKRGSWVLWTLLGFLVIAYLGNAFGVEPPADLPAVAIAGPGLALWLLIPWAYWADKHRSARRSLES